MRRSVYRLVTFIVALVLTTSAQAADVTPPVVTPPATITFNSTGLLTKVTSIGTATAIDAVDGPIVPTSDALTYMAPGRYTVTWSATDTAGNTGSALQTVDILPLVEFSKDLTTAEGNTINVRAILNGPAASYPVLIPYTVTGTATQPGDFLLANGTITINAGTEASIPINIVNDGNNGEADETIEINMGAPVNAVAGNHIKNIITLTENNLAPLITLQVEQLGIPVLVASGINGLVTVTATVNDPNASDTHSYDWSISDNILVDLDATANTFSFNPFGLVSSYYTARVIVTDSGSPAMTGSADIAIRIMPIRPVLSASLDTDGDGINDNIEGYNDSDNDGILDYLDTMVTLNVQRGKNAINDRYLLETEPDLQLKTGVITFPASRNHLDISANDIETYLKPAYQVGDVGNVGGIFDFSISGLPQTGQSARVVIPQHIAIPNKPIYRKYRTNYWLDFSEDANNTLASTLGEQGYCPPPNSTAYTPGLTPGDWCVLLTIEDGGPNDADDRANGTIVDPGGIAQLINVSINISGAGALNPILLLPLLFLYWKRHSHFTNKKYAFIFFVLLLSTLLNSNAYAADESLYLGGSLGRASDGSSINSINAELSSNGINATTTNVKTGRLTTRLYGGYQLSYNSAVEIGITDLGDVSNTIQGETSDITNFMNNIARVRTLTATGLDLSYVYRYHFSPYTQALGRAGIYHWSADYDLNAGTKAITIDNKGTDVFIGLGMEFLVAHNYTLALEWNLYQIDVTDINTFAIGLSYIFETDALKNLFKHTYD